MKYMKKKEPIKHTLVFGKQGCGKDLLIIGWLYHAFNEGKTIYANSELKFPYEKIESVKDIEGARNGLLYLHDVDLLFNSREWKTADKGLLELVNNMRKHRLSLFASCHRVKSIDVKVRSLINYFIQPRMVQVGENKENLWHWNIVYDVFDEFGKYTHSAKVKELPIYAGLYDTYECVRPLVG